MRSRSTRANTAERGEQSRRNRMKDFKGNVVVITGAGSGMGRSDALAFTRLGARLALNDVEDNGRQETVQLVQKLTQRPLYVRSVDVADDTTMQAFADEAQQRHRSRLPLVLSGHRATRQGRGAQRCREQALRPWRGAGSGEARHTGIKDNAHSMVAPSVWSHCTADAGE